MNCSFGVTEGTFVIDIRNVFMSTRIYWVMLRSSSVLLLSSRYVYVRVKQSSVSHQDTDSVLRWRGSSEGSDAGKVGKLATKTAVTHQQNHRSLSLTHHRKHHKGCDDCCWLRGREVWFCFCCRFVCLLLLLKALRDMTTAVTLLRQ